MYAFAKFQSRRVYKSATTTKIVCTASIGKIKLQAFVKAATVYS